MEQDELDANHLEWEITSLAARINSATCKWLELIAEFDEKGYYERWECRTTSHWLNWRCGIDMRSAREKVRVARDLQKFPLVKKDFSNGLLSYSKVRAITRVATPQTESELLGQAKLLTASQLELVVRSLTKIAEVDEFNSDLAFLNYRHEEDGSLSINGRFSPEDGEVIIAALEKAREGLRTVKNGSAEPPEQVTQADAFVAAMQTSLTTDTDEATNPYQVVLHVDIDQINSSDGSIISERGTALNAKTAKRIACDAEIVTQVENSEGEILSVGRKTRAIPTPLRRAMRSRDKTCRFPGCDARRFVDRHHIQHWANGGETKLSNLVTLCRRHHRFCHQRNVSIKMKKNKFRFYLPDGTKLHRMYCTEGNMSQLPAKDLRVHLDMLSGTGEPLTRWGLDSIVGYFQDEGLPD